jgi:hypothetical protein
MELSVAAAWGPATSAANPDSLAASLAQIAGLFGAGMLTEAEFSAAKSTVLGLATPQPAVPAAEAPVLLATAVAEQVDEPVVAAVVPVDEHTGATVDEHGVAPRDMEKKKRKRVERVDSCDQDTDPDWVPGTAGRRKARMTYTMLWRDSVIEQSLSLSRCELEPEILQAPPVAGTALL